ncbi:hypothetical protein Q1695_006972 [Nippostrongylus brasiliensis]|nr:hypothetical protein Q1695_006972 [Nippostrongylus brasiliensis]
MIIGFSFSPAAVTEDNGDVGFFVSGRINLHGVCSYLVHGSSINDVEGNGNFADIPDIVRRDVKGLILHELPEKPPSRPEEASVLRSAVRRRSGLATSTNGSQLRTCLGCKPPQTRIL